MPACPRCRWPSTCRRASSCRATWWPRVEALLGTAGLRAGLLELELTESVSMAEPERSLAIMHRLRALGVTLSIDDFGTGYSSFGYLKRLPIDKLKIDKSFVHDMVHSSDARAIVAAIVAMATA
ncbi:EAL domain-containing protein [Massilia sp. Dwa41.01b]|uniref:EAL domain-containing protein n=1 Tax=Massilia sp. Dwa41.01b TaxID=2709302 RepID=UPI0035A6A830